MQKLQEDARGRVLAPELWCWAEREREGEREREEEKEERKVENGKEVKIFGKLHFPPRLKFGEKGEMKKFFSQEDYSSKLKPSGILRVSITFLFFFE